MKPLTFILILSTVYALREPRKAHDKEGKNVDVCKKPIDSGPCRAIKQRFGFDKKTKRCKFFQYGGCGGNGNNFKTIEECKARCQRKKSKGSGIKKDEKVDLCKLPIVIGPCRAKKQRFGFDKKTKRCKLFEYGGCGGNGNNFKFLEACISRCDIKKSKGSGRYKYEYVDVCKKPIDQGPCRAKKYRIGFDKKTKHCKMFEYGGCGGNGNNFGSLEECKARCHRWISKGSGIKNDENVDLCKLPIVKGRCRARGDRFGFDKKTKRCKFFVYGGCGGNDNNFLTMEECKARCHRKKSKGSGKKKGPKKGNPTLG